MSRVKKILREACIIAATAVVGYAAIMGALAYKDWRGCVCSVLTSAEQTFPIDERLYRVCEKDTLHSGTFALVRTQCDHEKHVHLTVYPDEGIYKGYLLTGAGMVSTSTTVEKEVSE